MGLFWGRGPGQPMNDPAAAVPAADVPVSRSSARDAQMGFLHALRLEHGSNKGCSHVEGEDKTRLEPSRHADRALVETSQLVVCGKAISAISCTKERTVPR